MDASGGAGANWIIEAVKTTVGTVFFLALFVLPDLVDQAHSIFH